MSTATNVIVPMSLAQRRALAAIDCAEAALAEGIAGSCFDCEQDPDGICYAHQADKDASAWLRELQRAVKSANVVTLAALLAGTEAAA